MITVPKLLAPDRKQAALTARFLTPALPALEQTMLEMRARVDAAFAGAGPAYGQPYPYGCCLEITEAVLTHIRALLERAPSTPGERALATFLRQGGQVSIVWGVLRGRYFQNAFRMGGLYVDVSNDTVDVRKPKVEIMPLEQSGLEAVRDGEHYAEIAEGYRGQRCYANTALPSLAPLYPVIAVDRRGQVRLQSDTGYMLRLFAANDFQLAEAWLRRAPPPPSAALFGLRQIAPRDLLADNAAFGLDASLSACARLRAARGRRDFAWIESVRAQYRKLPVLSIIDAVA